MNIVLYIILVLLICVEVYPCDENHIICKTICIHEGDQLGIIIKDKCYCANERDTSKVIVKVPKQANPVTLNKPAPKYFFE